MLAHEPGTCSGSDLYFSTPSQMVRKLLFYMTCCGYYYTDYGYHITRDYVQEYLIIYICNGRLSIRCGSNTAIASEGQVCLLNCHKSHEYYTIGHTEFVWMHFYGSNTEELHDQIIALYGSHVFNTTAAPKIKDTIYSYLYDFRNEQIPPDLASSLRIYSMLLALLGGTPKKKTTTPTTEAGSLLYTDSMVESAIHFIGLHYKEAITVRTIAASVNMSPSHFARLFKKQSGYSPHEYLIQIRMNRAKHLLKTTNLPIKNISYEVGYEDVTTFSTAFSNNVGLTPSRFRRYTLG